MKKLYLTTFLIILFATGCLLYVPADDARYPSQRPSYREPSGYNPDVNISYFYEQLSPFGTWVYMRPHGYVWMPRHMGYRWRPYMNGRWVWTDYGWTWISEYDWGWMPFHYGRWGWDEDLGWFWVPGTVWGPAWVIWRSSDLYMGWAPLPPGADFVMGVGLSGYFDVPDRDWIFIEGRYFLEPGLYSHVLPYERNMTIIRYSVIHKNIFVRNNRIFNEGIDTNLVRNMTRKNLVKYDLRDEQRPSLTRVEGGAVRMYRPNIKLDERMKPKEFVNQEEARGELSKVKIYDPNPRKSETEQAGLIKRQHIEEERLLEKTQAEEIKQLQRKLQENGRRVIDSREREKIQRETEATLQDLKKKHEAEKQELKIRHKKDEEEVTKRKIKKD
jgi:Family of unknown function (DUF6600)